MPRIGTPKEIILPKREEAPSSAPSGEDMEGGAEIHQNPEDEARLMAQLELENATYLGEMKADMVLDTRKEEIVSRVQTIMDDCNAYKDGYEQYSYLWTVSFIAIKLPTVIINLL
jgi:hypothetical protein